MSKLAKKKANKSNTKQKNIIFDRVLLCFRRGNCYVMSMSKVQVFYYVEGCSVMCMKNQKLAGNRVEPLFGLNRIGIKRRVAPQTAVSWLYVC